MGIAHKLVTLIKTYSLSSRRQQLSTFFCLSLKITRSNGGARILGLKWNMQSVAAGNECICCVKSTFAICIARVEIDPQTDVGLVACRRQRSLAARLQYHLVFSSNRFHHRLILLLIDLSITKCNLCCRSSAFLPGSEGNWDYLSISFSKHWFTAM